MSVQVRDPFLAVTIDGSGATHYRVSHNEIANTAYTRLPEPQEDGTYVVPYNLPNIPRTYSVSCQLKNSIHESAIVSDSVVLLSDIVAGVSTLKDKLRIAQVYGPNADVDTYCDGIKCFYSWISLYNNSSQPIDLSSVKLWMSWGNSTSVYDDAGLAYNTTPDGTVTNWTPLTLSGIIQPNSYFLIRGDKANNIVDESIIAPNVAISFDTFVPDLILPGLFVSSKCNSLLLSDSSVSSVINNPFNSGALSVGYIDQHGITNIETSETYPNPYAIVNFSVKNSKQQVKTLISVTSPAVDNSVDYSSTSIKSLNLTTILATPARPRNSSYVAG